MSWYAVLQTAKHETVEYFTCRPTQMQPFLLCSADIKFHIGSFHFAQ